MAEARASGKDTIDIETVSIEPEIISNAELALLIFPIWMHPWQGVISREGGFA